MLKQEFFILFADIKQHKRPIGGHLAQQASFSSSEEEYDGEFQFEFYLNFIWFHHNCSRTIYFKKIRLARIYRFSIMCSNILKKPKYFYSHLNI